MHTTRRRRRRQAGFNLIEITVVLLIVSALATAVTMGVMKHWRDARIKESRTRARTIQEAVTSYLMGESGDCPTVADLRQNGELDPTTDSNDAWGNSFLVACEDNVIHVHSAGPDEEHGTADDVGF
jgi:prepilin-type N-terminal cleavage/methylation domain-containing protein